MCHIIPFITYYLLLITYYLLLITKLLHSNNIYGYLWLDNIVYVMYIVFT